MASPFEEGTKGSLPFINQYVDIEKEIIKIQLGEHFEEAKFEIEYYLNVNKEGIQIPLLFQALEFKREFKVNLNDTTKIEIKDIPQQYLMNSTKFDDFKYFLNDDLEVTIWWGENSGSIERLRNFKFFEIDLPVGKHKIKIEYIGNAWLDKSDWVRKYNYKYSLSPAKHWKSFGDLVIELDASNFQGKLTTNLGESKFKEEGNLMIWNFDELPANTIEIEYKPKIDRLTSCLISISPLGISTLISIILVIIHIIAIKENRKTSNKRFSVTVIIGSIILPILSMYIYVASYGLIDKLIGKEASQFHGYAFLVIFLYPIILIFYMTTIWQVDLYWKRKLMIEK